MSLHDILPLVPHVPWRLGSGHCASVCVCVCVCTRGVGERERMCAMTASYRRSTARYKRLSDPPSYTCSYIGPMAEHYYMHTCWLAGDEVIGGFEGAMAKIQ